LPVEATDERAAGWAVAERGLEVLAIERDHAAAPRPVVPLVPPGIDPTRDGRTVLQPLRLAARYARVLAVFLLILALLFAVGVVMGGGLSDTKTALLLSAVGLAMYLLPAVLCLVFAGGADQYRHWAVVALICLGGLLTLLYGGSAIVQLFGPSNLAAIIMAGIVVLLSAAMMVHAVRAFGVLSRAARHSAPAFEVRPPDAQPPDAQPPDAQPRVQA
jgi:hypothetical protein